MPVVDPGGKWRAIVTATETDPAEAGRAYRMCCIRGAEFVFARLDELTPDAPVDAHALIDKYNETPDARGGITGFMAGWIAAAVVTFHSRGAEFRVSWNAKYLNGRPDTGGTINPAIIEIATPEGSHG